MSIKVNLNRVNRLDLCVSHKAGEIKALKFSEYCQNVESLKIIEMIYNAFYEYQYYCPEIAKMKHDKGIRLRWKDGNEYINTSIYYNTPEKIYYTYGNHHAIVNAESPATIKGIQEFLESLGYA